MISLFYEKVSAKRTNRPGLSSTNRPPRGGRGIRGRGAFGRGYGGGYGGGGGGGAGSWFNSRGNRRPFRYAVFIIFNFNFFLFCIFRSRGWHSYSPY